MDENGDPVAADQGINGETIDRNTVEQNVDFMVKELDRAIALSDAYYGDPSSVVHLYKQTGKPIMIQNVCV